MVRHLVRRRPPSHFQNPDIHLGRICRPLHPQPVRHHTGSGFRVTINGQKYGSNIVILMLLTKEIGVCQSS